MKAGRKTRALLPAPAPPRKPPGSLAKLQVLLIFFVLLSVVFTVSFLRDTTHSGYSPLQSALQRRSRRNAGLPGSRAVEDLPRVEVNIAHERTHSHADLDGSEDILYDPLTDRKTNFGAEIDLDNSFAESHARAEPSEAAIVRTASESRVPHSPTPSLSTTPEATSASSSSSPPNTSPSNIGGIKSGGVNGNESHGGALTFVDALELPLRQRSARSRPFPSGRNVNGAYKANDGDVALLLPNEDPDSIVHEGLAYRSATSRQHDAFVGGVATAATRHSSEAEAEVAIVVISAPRWVPLQRDGVQRHYFRFGGVCSGRGVTSRPCALGTPVDVCVASLADLCDADETCVGFSPAGEFHTVADAAGTCAGPGIMDGQRPAPQALASPLRPDEGLYLKSPLSFFPAPRAVDVAADASADAPVLQQAKWFYAPGITAVSSRSIGHTPVTDANGAQVEVTAARAAAACEAMPGCVAFMMPSGELSSSVHPGDLTAIGSQFGPPPAGSGLYSRTPLPPLDYVTQTVVSLADELRDDCSAGGAFHGRVHLYVVDASATWLHELPPVSDGAGESDGGGLRVDDEASDDVPLQSKPLSYGSNATAAARHHRRGPDADDYWLPAFGWLRRMYGARRCITFLPATSYSRLSETARPPNGRGETVWQADNRGRNLARGVVPQTLDFVSGLRVAVATSPRAHMLVWEDDCFACAGTLATLGRAVDAVSAFDPLWGGFKVGNGGSGMLFHADIAAHLVTYLLSRRGSDNVDVSM